MRLSKKKLLQQELEADQNRVVGADDCPGCRARFSCELNRESHFRLYPTHAQLKEE